METKQISPDIEIQYLTSDQIFQIIESAQRGFFRGKRYGVRRLTDLIEMAQDEIGSRKLQIINRDL